MIVDNLHGACSIQRVNGQYCPSEYINTKREKIIYLFVSLSVCMSTLIFNTTESNLMNRLQINCLVENTWKSITYRIFRVRSRGRKANDIYYSNIDGREYFRRLLFEDRMISLQLDNNLT